LEKKLMEEIGMFPKSYEYLLEDLRKVQKREEPGYESSVIDFEDEEDDDNDDEKKNLL